MARAKVGGILLTVLVHGGLVAALLIAHRSGAALPEAPPRNYVVAKLVRLGKPRDPTMLPRTSTAPPPTAQATPINPNLDPSTAPSTPTVKPDPQAVPSNEFERARLRAKRLGEVFEEAEGSPLGSPSGTADTASEGDPYATAIDAAIRDEWTVPDLVRPEDLARLAATLFLRIKPDGTIVESRIIEPSGNRMFDASVIEAIARVKKLPAPPSDRMRSVVNGGITIVFRP